MGEVLPGFVSERRLGAVVTDFSPLREPLKWLDGLKKKFPKDVPLIQVNGFLNCTFILADFFVSRCLKSKARCLLQVDAHNIVPCWVASPKLEYAARTIRGKITKQLPEFLTDFPLVGKHPHTAEQPAEVRLPLRNLSRNLAPLKWSLVTLESDLLTSGPSSHLHLAACRLGGNAVVPEHRPHGRGDGVGRARRRRGVGHVGVVYQRAPETL